MLNTRIIPRSRISMFRVIRRLCSRSYLSNLSKFFIESICPDNQIKRIASAPTGAVSNYSTAILSSILDRCAKSVSFVVLIVVAILLAVLFVGAVGVFVAVTNACVIFAVAKISLIFVEAITFLLFADIVLQIKFVPKYCLFLLLLI